MMGFFKYCRYDIRHMLKTTLLYGDAYSQTNQMWVFRYAHYIVVKRLFILHFESGLELVFQELGDCCHASSFE